MCLCDCGNKKIIRKDQLLNNSIVSCGCYQREKSKEANIKHGYYKERLYHVWDGMKQRCYNPNHVAYEKYGGRGIIVCDEWKNDYVKFREFMLSHGYDPEAPFGACTIDRIDNDGNYCPENCQIISVQEQQNNKSDVFSFMFNGKKTTKSGVARSRGISRGCIQGRLRRGWTLEDAINKPLEKCKKFSINGESHLLSEWAKIFGVPVYIIQGRLKTHTLEEIYNEWKEKGKLETKSCPKRYYCANGITQCRAQWAKELGIPETTLRYKLRKKSMQEIVDESEYR